MIIMIHTETTGLPAHDKPLPDPTQPRCVQVAAVQYDKNRNVINQFCLVMRRDGWSSTQGARQLHSIPEVWNDRYGVAPARMLGLLIGDELAPGMLAGAKRVVCSSLRFQKSMIEIEAFAMARKILQGSASYKMPRSWTAEFRQWDDIVDLAGAAIEDGRVKNIEDAYAKLLGKPFVKTYRADRDLQATADVFWKLVELGKVKV
jgi:hypothetical protein